MRIDAFYLFTTCTLSAALVLQSPRILCTMPLGHEECMLDALNDVGLKGEYMDVGC